MAVYKPGLVTSGQESYFKRSTSLRMAAQSRPGTVAHSLLVVVTRGATFILQLQAKT